MQAIQESWCSSDEADNAEKADDDEADEADYDEEAEDPNDPMDVNMSNPSMSRAPAKSTLYLTKPPALINPFPGKQKMVDSDVEEPSTSGWQEYSGAS